MSNERGDARLEVLAVVCWILPLVGLVWGGSPGAWWMYVLWLIVGTFVLLALTPDDA